MPFLDGFPDDLPFTLRDALGPLARLEQSVVAPDGPTRPRIVGFERPIRRFLESLILGEHCLIEGYPGLAKTRAAKSLAAALGLTFQRIQFVPDLMPSDLIYRERLTLDQEGLARIDWLPGPVFTNLLLADEINRASPKAQAALLEVTEERQVSPLYGPPLVVRPRTPVDEAKLLRRIGPFFGERRIDPNGVIGQHFVVLATMNPIEQEGVFPLSEAQLDRFAFKIQIPYPIHDNLDAIALHAFEPDDNGVLPFLDEAELSSDIGKPGDRGDDPEMADAACDADAEKAHVKSLYFFTRLRRLLLGDAARTRWSAEDNRNVRTRVAELVDFTHARRRLGEPPDAADESAKNLELHAILRDRQERADKDLQAARHAVTLENLLAGSAYPAVLSGSSPRGLIKLIRAAHAEALLDGCLDRTGTLAVPGWKHVAEVAPDVLGHRVRLAPEAVALGMSPLKVVGELVKWVETRP